MIKILTSKTCSQCRIAKQLIKKPMEEIDVNSDEGKEIIAKYNVVSLPFFLVDGNSVRNFKELI